MTKHATSKQATPPGLGSHQRLDGARQAELGYLIVDEFLVGFLESVALSAALTSGLIDRVRHGGAALSEMDASHLHLIDLLETAGVVNVVDGHASLSRAFRSTAPFMDLLEVKLEYALRLIRDLAKDPAGVVGVGQRMHGESDYVHLFSYGEASKSDPGATRATQDWVRYMSVLTKHEAPFVLTRHDFKAHRRMLDIGGNSGEFGFQACEAVPELKVTVFDLPGVVRAGMEWNEGRTHRERIRFVVGDVFVDELPHNHDLVLLKSVLHDWSDPQAETILARAWEALSPGGTLLIAERSRPELSASRPLPVAHITMLTWAWVMRTPDRYVQMLTRLGCQAGDIEVQTVDLDLPWMFVAATKVPR